MTNRVVIGQIYHEIDGVYHRFWGSVEMRKKEFEAIPGVTTRGMNNHYFLPVLGTSRETVDALKGAIYAEPISATWTRVTDLPAYVKQVKYSTTYKGDNTLTVTVWGDSIYIKGSFMLSRVRYDLGEHLNLITPENAPEAYRKSQHGDWEIKFSTFHTYTDAAKREFKRIIGGLLAGFMRDYPQALIEGRNQSRADKRERIRAKMQKLASELADLSIELKSIPADEPVITIEQLSMARGVGRRDGMMRKVTPAIGSIDEQTHPLVHAYREGYAEGKAEADAASEADTQTEGGV